MSTVTATLVALAGLYCVLLGAVALAIPAHASRFLAGLAGTLPRHAIELALRLCIGGAFVSHAPQLRWPLFGWVFGGLLLVTTSVLMLVPWRRHRAFAQRTVPQALRHPSALGLAALALGLLILVSLVPR